MKKTQKKIRMKDNVMTEVKKTFKPEFINRYDDIIVFHKLSKVIFLTYLIYN